MISVHLQTPGLFPPEPAGLVVDMVGIAVATQCHEVVYGPQTGGTTVEVMELTGW